MKKEIADHGLRSGSKLLDRYNFLESVIVSLYSANNTDQWFVACCTAKRNADPIVTFGLD